MTRRVRGGVLTPVEIAKTATGVTVSTEIASIADGVTIPTTTTVTEPDGSRDAFGRWRVSDTGQRFDVEFTNDDQSSRIMNKVTNNGATITYDTDSRDVVIANGDTTDGTDARFQSKIYIPYTPGNSQLCDITGTLDNGDIGSGTCEVFLRSNITGIDDEIVLQADWDNATSGVDWTTSQIFAIDFQSLRVGGIRFGLVRNRAFVPVATINNDNLRATGYWQTPSLPVIWRCYNTATETITEIGYGDDLNMVGFRYRISVNDGASIRAVCATVKSEGGADLFDIPGFPVAVRQTGLISISTTIVPIVSIRVADAYNTLVNRQLVIPKYVEFLALSQSVEFLIYLNPTLGGGTSFASAGSDTGVEFDIASTTISGGTYLGGGFAPGNNRGSTSGKNLLGRTALTLDAEVSGDAGDIYTIAAVRGGTSDATGRAVLGFEVIR